MDSFIPFIHTPERKKKDIEQQPLYVELIPPPEKSNEEEEKEESRVVIIELF